MDDHPTGPEWASSLAGTPLSGILVYERAGGTRGAIVAVHGDAEGTVGHSLAELRADPLLLAGRVHPDDRGVVEDALASADSGREVTVDYRVRSRSDGVRWVRDTFRRDPDRPDRIVGLLRDVSVERTLREQVAALERRIWQSQRMDSLGALAAGVAHDFNNLLTTILSSVQLLQESDLTREGRADLALIRQAAERGGRMVRQILRFARRGDTFMPGEVDVGAIVEDLRPILERTLGVGCELRIRVTPELPAIRCDPAQIEQILLNLIVNARDAMPTGGRVRVTVTEAALDEGLDTEEGSIAPGRYVVARVGDDGPGIPEEVRARMFEPFFTTKSGDEGTGSGFGLSTVHRIVRGYGGGVTVETVAGEGTTFGIWLPVDAGVAGAGLLPDTAAPGGAEPEGPRVLVAEGDGEAREAVARLLARDGHRVVSVGSATEALRAFDRAGTAPALAFVSSVLPDRYGRELVTALRRRAPYLPVILASSQAPGDREGHRDADVDAAREGPTVLLARPFTGDQLRAAVSRALADDDRGGAARRPSMGG